VLRHQRQVERHPDGDEEQPEQQAPEGLQFRLDHVAVFGFRQQHTAKEGAQRQG
jgi:hypothetical protein